MIEKVARKLVKKHLLSRFKLEKEVYSIYPVYLRKKMVIKHRVEGLDTKTKE